MSTAIVKDAQIITQMTKAGIPRTCWSVSAKDSGRQRFHEFANAVKDRHSMQSQQTVAYIRHDGNGLLDLELMGKALVLAGVTTRYVPYHKLTRDIETPYGMYDGGDLEDVYGKGAIIVPDLPTLPEVLDPYKTGYQEAVAYLVGHAYDGGVLVIGSSAAVTLKPRRGSTQLSPFPMTLERLLLETS